MSSDIPKSQDLPKKGNSISIAELKNIRINIPAGTLPAGISLVIVASAAGTQTGWIDDEDRPSLMPLDDIQRLYSIPKMLHANDSLEGKSLSGTAVRLAMMRSSSGSPNPGPASAANIASALGLAEIIDRNCVTVLKNGNKDGTGLIVKDIILNAIAVSRTVLASYITSESTSGGMKKTLKEFAFEMNIPYWLFAKVTMKDWVPEEPQLSLTRLLFPKNLGKAITLRIEEWRKPELLASLGPLMKWSVFERGMATSADTLTGYNLTALEAAKLLQIGIPLGSPYTIVDNLLNSRTAPAPPQEGLFSDIKQLLSRKAQSQTGIRNRSYNTNSWWGLVTGKTITIDRTGEPVRQQVISTLAEEKDIFIDDIDEEKIKTDAFRSAILGIPTTDVMWKLITEMEYPDLVEIEEPHEVADKTFAILKSYQRNKDGKLIATDQEKVALQGDLYELPTTGKKVRRFPGGGYLTARGAQAVKAVEKSTAKNASPALRGLLSSFSSSKVTDHAANIVFSELFRMEEDGVLFSTLEIAEGINADLSFTDFGEAEEEDVSPF